MIWRERKLLDILGNHIVEYPVGSNISYLWGMGSLSGVCLGIQLISGILLSLHYSGGISEAFDSIEHVMRDVSFGWMLRYVHSNGASVFFMVVYIHIMRGIYYGSYVRPRGLLWNVGVVLVLLMIVTGFIGYVLPWGQMSLWGATVITNLVSALPLVGTNLVEWIWSEFSVGNATLLKFFGIHFTLPFVLSVVGGYHLSVLHMNGSSNKLGLESDDKIDFIPYCYVKDSLVFMTSLILIGVIIYYLPNILGHPDNYILANSLVTPAHIVPEWYFLPFYAILRAIDHKLTGVILMLCSILCLMLLPICHRSGFRSSSHRDLYKVLSTLFILSFCVLMFLGQCEIAYPFTSMGRIFALYYFAYLLWAENIGGDFMEYWWWWSLKDDLTTKGS